jgi:coproporphyrinogen III oxidase-like Fe-S oxidoreductase
MTGMRLLSGISIKDLEHKTGIEVPKDLLDRFIKIKRDGYIEMEEKDDDIMIRFTRDGFFLMDNLIYEMTEMMI